MTLTIEADLNNYVQISCLPKHNSDAYPVAGLDAIAAGWGSVVTGGPVQNVLNNVKLQTYEHDQCSKTAPEAYLNSSSQICAGIL